MGGVEYDFTEKHEKCFNQIKENVITNAIGVFDRDWWTTLTVDASPVGLGSVVTQENPNDPQDVTIVSIKSRKLTATEQKYSQVEKEGLGCVWGMTSNQLYLLINWLLFNLKWNKCYWLTNY